jgi:hypothetical protein
MHVEENSYFWSAKKVTDSTSSDLESFVSLVGGVSSDETALAARYKNRSSEFAAAVDQLVANKEQSMVPLMRPRSSSTPCKRAPRNKSAYCSGRTPRSSMAGLWHRRTA